MNEPTAATGAGWYLSFEPPDSGRFFVGRCILIRGEGMDWASVGEMVKVLGPVATAVAAWFAATTAYRGVNKWRAETTGKRNAQLTEEVLADFYQAKGIFEWARDIDTPGGEGDAGKAEPGENPEQSRYRNALYAPIQRLTDQNEFFAAMAARRFRFKAVFGPAADKPASQLRANEQTYMSASEARAQSRSGCRFQ
jgi:hypothetical protein